MSNSVMYKMSGLDKITRKRNKFVKKTHTHTHRENTFSEILPENTYLGQKQSLFHMLIETTTICTHIKQHM